MPLCIVPDRPTADVSRVPLTILSSANLLIFGILGEKLSNLTLIGRMVYYKEVFDSELELDFKAILFRGVVKFSVDENES